MSEDCLALNIWTPAKAGEKLPVMVWIYGGALENGSASTGLYSGDRLASRGVVVVTFNYRLGVLGFLSHPELAKETTHASSGNYGLLDQIAALAWVHRNIAAFGGDPDRVTIFGQSSGAISISALVASPLAKGLFRRVIGQSGGLFEPVELDPDFTRDGAEKAGLAFARRAGAASLTDLRQMPAETLLKTPFAPKFNIDGFALTKSPFDVYRDGSQNEVDLLVGSNAEEGQLFLDKTSVTVANFNEVLAGHFPAPLVWLIGAAPGASDAEARTSAAAFETDMRFRWDMWTWARLAAAAGERNVFLYEFRRAPPFRKGERYYGLGATHGMEMPYVFDHLDQQQVAWTESDRALASAIPAYWTNFAATGDPNGADLPRWPSFTASNDLLMVLGDKIGPQSVPNRDRLERMDRVYAVARFVVQNPYTAVGAALAVALIVIALLFLAVRRLWRRIARASLP